MASEITWHDPPLHLLAFKALEECVPLWSVCVFLCVCMYIIRVCYCNACLALSGHLELCVQKWECVCDQAKSVVSISAELRQRPCCVTVSPTATGASVVWGQVAGFKCLCGWQVAIPQLFQSNSHLKHSIAYFLKLQKTLQFVWKFITSGIFVFHPLVFFLFVLCFWVCQSTRYSVWI